MAKHAEDDNLGWLKRRYPNVKIYWVGIDLLAFALALGTWQGTGPDSMTEVDTAFHIGLMIPSSDRKESRYAPLNGGTFSREFFYHFWHLLLCSYIPTIRRSFCI